MKNIVALTFFFFISLAVLAQSPTFKIDYKFTVDEQLLQTSEEDMDETKKALITTAALALAFQDGDKPIAQVWVNKKFVKAKASLYKDHYEINNKEEQQSIFVYPEMKEYYKSADVHDKVLDLGDTIKLASELPIEFIEGNEKTIAGYTCKLAKINVIEDGSSTTTIDVWYTEEIPSTYWGDYSYLKNIPGAALEISTSGIGIQASTIEATDDRALFTVPEDYTEVENPIEVSDLFSSYESESLDEEKPKEYYVSEDLIAFLDEESGLYGIKTEDGSVLVEAKFSEIYQYDNGIATVADQEYNYGAINMDGDIVIPLQYETLTFNNVDNTFVFYQNGKGGVLGLDHTVIIPNDYDFISFFNEGKVIVANDSRYGIINNKNQVIVPLKYDNIAEIVGDCFISYTNNNECILYNTKGKQIAQYEYITNAFHENMFVVMQNNKYGYLNAEGKIVIPMVYDYASPFSGEVAAVIPAGEEEMVYINAKGEIVVQ